MVSASRWTAQKDLLMVNGIFFFAKKYKGLSANCQQRRVKWRIARIIGIEVTGQCVEEVPEWSFAVGGRWQRRALETVKVNNHSSCHTVLYPSERVPGLDPCACIGKPDMIHDNHCLLRLYVARHGQELIIDTVIP